MRKRASKPCLRAGLISTGRSLLPVSGVEFLSVFFAFIRLYPARVIQGRGDYNIFLPPTYMQKIVVTADTEAFAAEIHN